MVLRPLPKLGGDSPLPPLYVHTPNPIYFTFWSREKRIVRPQKFHMPNKREILTKGVQKQAKEKSQQLVYPLLDNG